MSALRALWGALLVFEPTRVLEAVPHHRINRGVVLFTRVLGARHIAQAAASETRRGSSRRYRMAGATVDAIHALTLLALALLAPDRRRLALTNVAIATAFALTGVREAGRC
ncbi:MAG: hypothetical protein ACR2ND_11435 [Solirubrobacteraceae bacterium]